MKTAEEILYFMRLCSSQNTCNKCPYYIGDTRCKTDLLKDSIELIVRLKDDLDHLEASQEPVEGPEPWTREKVLAEAKRCVCGERDQSYGGPEDSFRLIAKLWEPYVKEKIVPKETPVDIEPEDVAIMMGLLKVARLASNPEHMDSWVDLAGYAACGGEIAGKEVQE